MRLNRRRAICLVVFDPAHGWQEHSLPQRPAAPNAPGDSASDVTRNLGPSPRCLGYHPDCDENGVASISALFLKRPPVDVPWFIVAIHILTLQRMLLRRSRAKIVVEPLKAIFTAPLITDRNTASAVVDVRPAAGTETPIFHACPYLIFITVRHAVSNAMRSLMAAARRGTPTGKMASSGCSLFSARANTSPIYSTAGRPQRIENGKPSKLPTLKMGNLVGLDWSKSREKGRIYLGHWFPPVKSLSRGRLAHERLAASFA